jgi:hypothetical protein
VVGASVTVLDVPINTINDRLLEMTGASLNQAGLEHH